MILRLPGPFDLSLWAERYRRWGDDPVNAWDGKTYTRAIRRGGVSLVYEARQTGPVEIEMAVHPEREVDAAQADLAHRFAMDLPDRPLATLASTDDVIGRLVARFPGYRPPLEPDPFEALVTSITAQQVNLRWATETRRRLVAAFGDSFEGRPLFPSPSRLAEATAADLRELQFTWRKSEYILEVARRVEAGELSDFGSLADEDVTARLMAIRGVGRWTAEWFLARCLGRPRAVASGDLGVRKAVGLLYLALDRPASETETREAASPWGEAANWAAHLLLEALAADD